VVINSWPLTHLIFPLIPLGKTSLIKACAEFTGRSIINIPLGRIKTNEELSRLFFSNEYFVENNYYPTKLGFKDVIFVMEDVDAASKVVQRRDGERTQHMDLLPPQKSMWRMLLESSEEKCIELVELLMAKSERLKEHAQSADTLRSFAQNMTSIPGMSLVGDHSCFIFFQRQPQPS